VEAIDAGRNAVLGINSAHAALAAQLCGYLGAERWAAALAGLRDLSAALKTLESAN
jgi:hypothetical protein